MWINPQIFQAIVSINLIVALFNLVPFPPLDGAKIFSWRKLTWFSMLLSVIVLLYLPPFIGVIASIGITILLLVVIFILLQLSAPKTYSSPYRMP
jgi:Zn-dependent protease